MLFWFIAIAVTAIACAALYYAAGWRVVNADAPESDDANSHFRLVLAGIDADLAAGKLGEGEATAAKGELAREILRLKSEAGHVARAGFAFGSGALVGGLALVAVLALGLYASLGSPDLPSQPLSGRADVAAQQLDLDTAIARIEAQLTANPDDLRGWTVIAPAYVEQARYADAVRAYRRIIDLNGATPDLQTSLAEALLLEGSEAGSDEAIPLLQAAAAADPAHVMSRLYLASVLTGVERYDEAVPVWTEVLALAKGDEPWFASAQQGLAVAQNDGAAPASDQEAEMIGQMVSGLAERLAAQGGSIEEWTQLVRAYLVLGDTDQAQAAFDAAVAAYPQAFDRGDLDTLALGAGLTINGAQP
jgi:cytochrome c-type biogenesis protein CcmH